MHFENGLTSFHVRFINGDLPVKPSGTKQRSIQYIWPVSGGQYNDSTFPTKSIHLHQQLVKCAFTFIITHDGILTARSSYRINLINENNTGRFFSRLFK